MECPSCHQLHCADSKFCTACGVPMPLVCSHCGSANPSAARFCGDCGTKLPVQPAAGAKPPSPSNSATVGAERRQLTVMFCDLVGSTSLSARHDPEDMRDLIAAYRSSVTDAVARFDGFIARYLGDGVLVYFGYPKAHEDDAERAVRAALAATAAVNGLRIRAGVELRAHIGIATGLVVVGEPIEAGGLQERDAIGETPNLAARLQAVAGAGEVVIAASTRRQLGRMFEFRALGLIDVKGLPQPVEAWQVLSETAGVSRFEARHAGVLPPVVGRQEEIELLLRRWDQAKAGEGRVVLLAGEPGIGKSRIAESLLGRLEGEPLVRLRYYCSPHHTHSTLYPFIAQLERAAGLEPSSSDKEKLDKLEALLNPTAENVSQHLSLIAELLAVPSDGRYQPLKVSPQQKREMMLEALLGQLDGIAAQTPVLMVFEDAHWIDPTSLDLLNRTVARVAGLPVLLVVTFRPELQPSWVGQQHVTLLSLNRLGRRDSAGIVDGVTKGKALPVAVADQILVRTDGVPLFIEELTRTLIESGLLRETPDSFVLDGPLPPLAIPTTLQASLVARLDRLASVKDVAQIGAAIGREFSHELIAAVSGMAPMDLDAALERLTASGLISRRGVPPVATYAFKHALVQDAAYITMLKSRRQQLHADVAKVLVERLPTLADGLPELVAHHFTEAGLASEAIGYWRKAGQQASARSANREAVKFFEQALSILAAMPENQSNLELAFDIRIELRTVSVQLSEVRRALAQLREAETLAEQLNDDRRRGRVYNFMTSTYSLLGELDEALVTGTRALEVAGRLGDMTLRIPATTYLEQTHYFRGEFERVVELATENMAALPPNRASELFGIGAPPSIYDRSWKVMSLAQLGRFVEANKLAADAIRLAEPTHNAFAIGMAYYGASMLHLIKGDWARASALTEHWIAVFRSTNVALLLPMAVYFSAWALAQLDEASEALERIQEAEQLLELDSAQGLVGRLGLGYHALGRACLRLGQLDEACSLGYRAIECSPGHNGLIAHALHLLGDIASHSDWFDAESGEAFYRRALALAEPRGMRPLIAHCHLGLGKLFRRASKRAQGHEHLTNAKTLYREMDMNFWLEMAEMEMSQTG